MLTLVEGEDANFDIAGHLAALIDHAHKLMQMLPGLRPHKIIVF